MEKKSSVKINYNLLMNTSKNLEDIAEKTTSTTISNIENIVDDINKISKNHDYFITTSSKNINNSVEDIDLSLKNISTKASQTVKIFSNAELCITNKFNINSVGLRNVYQNNNKNSKEITAGYDHEYYQKILDSLLNNTSGTRAKTTASAIFLATTFPHLPYFWGGGHDYIYNGIDPSWGTPKTVIAGGHETTGTKQPYSLDCSGYVSWALKNGGYNIESPKVTKELEKMGDVRTLKGIDPNTINNGDLGYMDGHVGMVINVEGNKVTVAHCSGSGNGMNITTIDTKTGKVVEDATNKERIGNEYFDRIISIDYKD